MEEEKIHFSFWKRIESSKGIFKPGELLDPESVILNNRLFITGRDSENNPVDLREYDFENDTWDTHSVQGFHPCTDGNSTIYLLIIPDNSDYRYQVIEYSLETLTGTLIDTTGIAPKKRKPTVSSLYFQGCIYFFGGMQIYRGDATGSFVYRLDLETKEWSNVEYSGQFPATVPHAPHTGCRSGHSTVLVGHKTYIFGGTMIEDSLLNAECLTSSIFDNFNTNDLHEFDILQSRWSKIAYKPIACMIPTMTQHAAAANQQFMYIYYEEKIYRYEFQTQNCYKLKKSLKAPKCKGQCTMQLINNYLYLFGNTNEGAMLYRLNLGKGWVWVPGDTMPDYSNFFNHQPTSDLLVKVGDQKIYAHKQVMCRFSSLLRRQLTPGIRTISISEFPFIVINMLVEQLYQDCQLELPRELSHFLQLYRAAHWLGVEEIVMRCQSALNVSPANLRAVIDLVGDIPSARQKCLDYVKTHLKESAMLLAPEQLSELLQNL